MKQRITKLKEMINEEDKHSKIESITFYKDADENKIRGYINISYSDGDRETLDGHGDNLNECIDELYWQIIPDDDPHLGCPSYPNCDESPTGCVNLMGKDVEWFGFKD